MLLLYSSNSYGLNWGKCKRYYKRIVRHSIMGEAGLTTSSQFSTSTGECSMIGQVTHDKKVFIVKNSSQLKVDSARGHGEYLTAYASIIGCDSRALIVLQKSFKINFSKIYGADAKNSSKRIYEGIENILQSNVEISSGCKLQS